MRVWRAMSMRRVGESSTVAQAWCLFFLVEAYGVNVALVPIARFGCVSRYVYTSPIAL